jgi:hypothetical protein
VMHLRARRAMAGYDRARSRPTAAVAERTRGALTRLVGALVAQDVAAVEAALAESVRTVNDGGGEFFAARVPVVGRAKVAGLYLKLTRTGGAVARAAVRTLNGLPALVLEFAETKPGIASRMVLRCETDEQGRIEEIQMVLATRKLTAIAR